MWDFCMLPGKLYLGYEFFQVMHCNPFTGKQIFVGNFCFLLSNSQS
ncbi:unknown [Firmicutes bacterium CAG:194]|nr:unknown [Firmicutes bacterium CAG:194]